METSEFLILYQFYILTDLQRRRNGGTAFFRESRPGFALNSDACYNDHRLAGMSVVMRLLRQPCARFPHRRFGYSGVSV
jgi:hypothetical protein